MLDPPPANRLGELQTRFESQLNSTPNIFADALIFNARVAPFNDVRVRRALNYAVDRAEVARLVGADAQPTCQMLTPFFTGYQRYCPYTVDPTRSGLWRAPDLATAQRLITASRTRGTPVTIWLPYDPGLMVAGRYLVALLNRLGYPARLRDIIGDPDAYAKIADSRTKAQAFLWNDGSPLLSTSQLIEIYFGCQYFAPNSPTNGNIAEFCDPRLDAQIASARATEEDNSSADASALLARADHTLTDDAAQVPLEIPSYIVLVSKRVGNYQASASQGVLPDQLWVR